MIRYAALLRGIAPSGRNMTNNKLRGVFERLGYERVGSVLSSGNIVFSAEQQDIPALEQRIEEALIGDLEVRSRTIVRTQAELQALVDTDPFPGLTHEPGQYLTATFIKDAKQAPPTPPPAHPDRFSTVVGYDREARAVLAITDNRDPGKTGGFMAWLERTYGKDITTRSWLTVQRILAKLQN